MYHQTLIRPKHRIYEQIHWRDLAEEEIKGFKLLTVTYGVISAPYLAIRCFHELNAQKSHRFLFTNEILTNTTFLDDKIFGADLEEDLLLLQKQIMALLKFRWL